jgi:hypothetical protein
VARYVPKNIPETSIVELIKRESRDVTLKTFDKDLKSRLNKIDDSLSRIKKFIFSLAG